MGSPKFDEIKIHPDADYYPGKEILIRLNNQSENIVYLPSDQWKGKHLTSWWIYHKDEIIEGELVIQLRSEPDNKSGGEGVDS